MSTVTAFTVEVLAAGHGREHVSHRLSETSIGRRLTAGGGHDPVTGLTSVVKDGRTTLTNDGPDPVLLLAVTSLAVTIDRTVDALDLVEGDGEWLGEGRWTRRPLREVIPDLHLRLHGQDGRGCHARVGAGSWSTAGAQPVGGLIDRETGDAWLWEIAHNGPWRWEIGERLTGVHLALSGPTDADHQWRHTLLPGASFTTVPATLMHSPEGLHGAVAALTAHRRATRRPHPDQTALPVVFNDYMNTLMGDPTTAKLLPLIDAAADAGADVFCVDAGWYDNGTAWWDSVGEWQPSQTRFPRGLAEVLGRIRDRGLTPGLWLEPEVIGVRSPMADKLPGAAFLQRGGVRVVEHGRFHLDLRHPAATAHLDEVVDRLVEQFGVGYFKLDYNIEAGPGTDLDAESAGAGLLQHNRAHLDWLDRVLDRHPALVLENCASGGMRADQALLSRMQLQSTSDQQDFRRYPPIAVAAPMTVPPEQSASWAYPQPEMSPEEIAYTLVTGALGRLYLSGRLNAMSTEQRGYVREAVDVHKRIRADLAASVPIWPLGLPGWEDRWLALGLRTGDVTYLAVWRRAGAPRSVRLDLPRSAASVEVLYPRHLPAWELSPDGTITDPTETPYAARLFRIS